MIITGFDVQLASGLPISINGVPVTASRDRYQIYCRDGETEYVILAFENMECASIFYTTRGGTTTTYHADGSIRNTMLGRLCTHYHNGIPNCITHGMWGDNLAIIIDGVAVPIEKWTYCVGPNGPSGPFRTVVNGRKFILRGAVWLEE